MNRFLTNASHSDMFRLVLVWLARARRGRFGSRILTPLHASAGVLQPFFIVGAGRSGNTLVRAILHAHTDLSIPPESYALRTVAWRGLVFRDDAWPRQVARVLDAFDREDIERTWQLDLGDIRDRLLDVTPGKRGVDAIVDEVYRWWSRAHAPTATRWGDKTPMYALQLPWIDDLFPGAQYVHVLRDGRDSALSYVRAGLQPTVKDAARRWVTSVRQVRRFAASLPADRFLEVRYEDLVETTVEQAQQLCRFLRVNYQAGMLEYWRDSGRLGDADLKHFIGLDRPVYADSVGRWKSLSASEIEHLATALGPTLAEMGYA